MPEQWNEASVEAEAQKLETVETPVETEPTPQVREKVEERVEKVVPLGALDSERAKRREIQARETATRQELEQVRRELVEIRAKQQPQPPDASQDPAGAILYQQQLTQQQLEEMQRQRTFEQQQQAQRQQFDGFVAEVRSRAGEYVKANPEAEGAIDFLKQSRVEEYKAMGMSHAEANQRMLKDELDLSAWALQNGDNPAEVAHNMARARGYVASKQKLEMQKAGQGASTPSGGGGKSGGQPSYDALLKMSNAEFAKATEGDAWAKLMNK